MSKSLRLSEQWFRRGLWLVAFVFAGFLIGLGGKVVGNLNLVEETLSIEQFMDPARDGTAHNALQQAEAELRTAQEAYDQAEQQHQVAQANTESANGTFQNWLATRHATARPEQDTELMTRTRELDALKATERKALAAMQAQQQKRLDANQAADHARANIQALRDAAYEPFAQASRARELRVFGYRLLLTLPLLVLAGWLWKRHRHGAYWPFVWGFIYFAGFAFFVELVPYLPSYGGYVRYIVGIVLTVVVGRQAIVSLQRYLERQKAAEAMPDTQRRESLGYDMALARLAKSVCPGCERAVDLKDGKTDYCPHCGICLFNHCGSCNARKNTFNKFCFSCGTQAPDAPAA
jgi:hypothetical protein